MPVKLANTPANWAGNSSPAGVAKNKPQVSRPNTKAKIAPCVVARFQSLADQVRQAFIEFGRVGHAAGQDDDLIGNWGSDWISGGTGSVFVTTSSLIRLFFNRSVAGSDSNACVEATITSAALS